MKNYLNFENEIKNIETEIDKLKDPYNQEGLSEVDTSRISKVEEEINEKLEKIYSNLDPWQTALVARHEDRPKAKFFVENLFDDFIQLSGDRYYGEDKAVIAGFAKFDGKSVLVIGQEKGSDLNKRIDHNFGMMRPEGYRKTIRLMELANKFKIPIEFAFASTAAPIASNGIAKANSFKKKLSIMMKDQFVLHLDPLFASSDLRGITCSSKAKAAKAKKNIPSLIKISLSISRDVLFESEFSTRLEF